MIHDPFEMNHWAAFRQMNDPTHKDSLPQSVSNQFLYLSDNLS